MTTTSQRHGVADPVGSRWGRSTASWVVAVVVAVVLGGVLVGWFALRAGDTQPVPWSKPARVDGAAVHLSYMGSECRAGAAVDVEESAEQVVLTVRETVHARSCSDVGVVYEHSVRLDAPLGDRELVDGACSLEELARRSECS